MRYESSVRYAGLPLISIARGPDADTGEVFGSARGIVAIGDTAGGVFAFGGLAVRRRR